MFPWQRLIYFAELDILTQMKEPKNESDPQQVLRSIRASRIILPALIGAAAVAYLFWRQFDPAEFANIQWTGRAWFWLGVSIALGVLRHLAYAARLRVLSHGALSWPKCIELIFIWEFASAVSPTSLGGSAVAFFILGNEKKLSLAKATTVVLYTIVLDGFFLLATLPILFVVIGPTIMRPDAGSFAEAGGWGVYFLVAYLVMLAYTGIFFYGLFFGPHQMKRILLWFTRLPFLKRFHHKAEVLGDELILASAELQRERLRFHLKAFGHTIVAWSTRFLLLSALLIAFVPAIPLDFRAQFELYARLETMFFVIAFSPTPGGAGLIELLFGGFLSDYVTNSTYATVISTVWRLLSYYVYLFAGAVLVPNWIRKVLRPAKASLLKP